MIKNNQCLQTETEKLNNNEKEIEIEIPEIPLEVEEDITKIKINKAYKRHLMFKEKPISLFRLTLHLSYTTERVLLILAILSSLISGSSMPVISLLLGNSIEDYQIASESRLETQSYLEKLLTIAQLRKNSDKTVKRFLYIGVLMWIATFLSNFLWEYLGLKQVHHLKEKYFSVILKQEQGWFDINNPYEFSTKVQAQIEQIEFGLGEKSGQTLELISQCLSGLIIAFTVSWELTLIILSLSPLFALSLFGVIYSLKKAIILSRKTYEKAGGMAEEMLYNIKTVISFSNYEYEMDRFNKKVDQVYNLERQKAFKLALSVSSITFLTFCAFAIVVLYSKNLIADGKINPNTGKPYSAGDAFTVNFAIQMAVTSIDAFGPNIKILQEASHAASDYFTLLERKVNIDESNSVLKPDRSTIKGKIEFKNITFIYPSDKMKKPILQNLNLIIEPGTKVAIVGESGCGKSTTVNLIERLYEPQMGEILLDDINIKNYDLKYLRSLIGYVQQEPILFNNSIKDNIIFGRQQTIMEEFEGKGNILLKDACNEAFAMEFIEKKEEKFDYVVGIKGSRLSGGQKQRIAIARAILLKPKILILDEATSALDNKSEKQVQKALDNISGKNVTTIIIAHRLSTIKNADVIFALKDGKVIEKGTHDQLLKLNGYYAGLVKSQLGLEKYEKDDKLKKHKSSISSYNNKNKDNISEINLEENKKEEFKEPKKKIGLRMFTIFNNNKKYFLIIGTIASLLNGCLFPVNALIRSKCVNALSNVDPQVVRHDGTKYGCIYFIIAICGGLFLFSKICCFQNIGNIICTTMRKTVIAKYLSLHMGFFDFSHNAPGALLSRLSIDTTQMNVLVLLILGDITQSLGVLICGIIIGVINDYRLLLIGICFAPFSVAAHILINKSRISGRTSFRNLNIEAGSIISESVINTKSIFAFNFQEKAVSLYIHTLDNIKKDFLKSSIEKGIILAFGIFAVYAGRATMFHFSAVFIINGTLTFDNMNILLEVTTMIAKGTSESLRGVGLISRALLAFNSVFNIIDTKPLIDVSIKGNQDKIKPTNIKGKIEFKNVSFAYPTKPDHLVLKNLSFTIEAGKSAALVGYSGCGKSTIIQLLERFYDVNEGEILIDDINIKNYDINELRKRIGLVSQEPVLFKRSVYQNILYGKLTANIKEVYMAAKKACIEKFFGQKEMGTKESPVSGGEKQRLAIARAFLKDPTILLLDEATSALDKESEKEVQKSIDELMKNRTSLSVAHRLSTIINSDIIFVLEDGKIVESGNHTDLMNINKKYAYLYHASISN